MDAKNVHWESDRLCHYIIAEYYKMKQNILKMGIEDIIGQELNDINIIKEHKIRYTNNIVEGSFPGMTSNISVDGTIALMKNYGDFYVPDEVKEYIKEAYERENLDLDSFPRYSDQFEQARLILEAFMEAGYSYYASCCMTGAAFVECAWNVHVYNKLEFGGGGAAGTAGWTGCGEGLFGLTFWNQKEKVIKKLGNPNVSANQAVYSDNGATHLMDLDEEEWAKIAKIYLEDCAKKQNDVLSKEDEPSGDRECTETLCAGYLWKAGQGLDPTLEDVKKMVEKYMATHKSQAKSPSYKPKNGFCYQVAVSILVDQYLHEESTLSLEDCNIDFSFDIDTDYSGYDFKGRYIKGTQYGSAKNDMAFRNQHGYSNESIAKYSIGKGTRAEVVKKLGFSDNPTKEECGKKMKTIEIEAYPGRKITVHESLTEEVQGIFKELKLAGVVLNNKIGGYCFRPINNPNQPGSKTLSMHSFGCAIDINYDLNPFIAGGKPHIGSGDDTIRGIMRTNESPIVKAFAKYGWGWGGRYGDYMHFSKANGG